VTALMCAEGGAAGGWGSSGREAAVVLKQRAPALWPQLP